MTTVGDAEVDGIPGAFWPPDWQVFRTLLDATAAAGPGDLAELGVLYGRSAVLIGGSLRDGETFTAVDLFEAEPDDAANAVENARSYPGLSRAAFEDNYRRVHGRLPAVVVGPSESVVDHVPSASHRFVHVDASHLHEHVVKDIDASRRILRADGVLALDDIRSPHTPGVAAAAWQAVLTSGLRPIAVSTYKLYATFGDPEPFRRVLLDLADAGAVEHEVQLVNGEPLVRVWQPRTAPVLPWRRWVPEVAWPAVAWTGGRALRASRRMRGRRAP